MPIRLSAAILFKNTVRELWNVAESAEPALKQESMQVFTEQDRGVIKQNILKLMLILPKLLQDQISQAMNFVCVSDFPAKWSNLLPVRSVTFVVVQLIHLWSLSFCIVVGARLAVQLGTDSESSLCS